MRIKVSGELGTVVMSLAVIGLYYGAASFLIENAILLKKNGMNIF